MIGIQSGNWANQDPNDYATFCMHIPYFAVWIYQNCGLGEANVSDLYIEDDPFDIGAQPNTQTGSYCNSSAIWVKRNGNAPGYVHENPLYSGPGSVNEVRVRITNTGCVPSTGNEILNLYWAKANTYLSWPSGWNGTQLCNGQPMGQPIASVNIPVIAPGNHAILEFPWSVPYPANYAGCSGTNWANNKDVEHRFCFLARITNEAAWLNISETADIVENAKNSNSIAIKNVTVVDLNPNPPLNTFNGGTLFVGQRAVTGPITINFANTPGNTGNSIFDEATIMVTLSSQLWDRWQTGGSQGTNVSIVSASQRMIRLTKANAELRNIVLNPNESFKMHVGFAAIPAQLTSQQDFYYTVLQKSDDQVMGAENVWIRKTAPAARDEYESPLEEESFNFESIAEVVNNNEIEVYPNPVKDVVTLVMPGAMEDQVLEITIYDLTGKKMLETKKTKTAARFDINLPENMSAGIYTMNVVVNNTKKQYKLAVVR